MRKPITFFKNYFAAKILKNKTDAAHIREYLKGKKIVKRKGILTAEQVNREISERILSGKPFFAGRFGANELSAVKTFDFKINSKFNIALDYLNTCAGFFPPTVDGGTKFTELMLQSVPSADIMGIWMLPFEKYYLNRYGSVGLQTTYLFDLEPWSNPEAPWSAALSGKKVLVIHPFADTIKRQYKTRKSLFPGTNVLPEFELSTVKAVQTIAGEKDERFSTWFDALDYMTEESLKKDFDVAVVGCGAYGFPLSARLKSAGKQAIHLGGATQLLFGIKGKRWENDETYSYVNKFFNENWVYPDEKDKPKNAVKVENGCYW